LLSKNLYYTYCEGDFDCNGLITTIDFKVPSFRSHRKYDVKMFTALGDIETHARGYLLAREICNKHIQAASFPIGQSSLRQLNQILEFVGGLNLRVGAIEDALNHWFLGVA
jgi:hypothetical protein